jgi:H+-translocating NAD(P) transhydrogenase subunit alpha
MKLAVPRETKEGERRVAIVPESCKKIIKAGIEVFVEAGAGGASAYSDELFAEAGAKIETDAAALLANADFIARVQPPGAGAAGRAEIDNLRPNSYLICTLLAPRHPDIVRQLAQRGVTCFATDAIPRTTRAQAMDTLSSMANIGGYKAVLLAAANLPRYFPMLMTAAGTVKPAKVFIIGAGVAGLQAIATARRLGAAVTATDVRPEVKEQIESLGAKYVGIELKESAQAGGGYAKELSAEDQARQAQLLAEQCAQSDVVITTALIRGVFAPKLIKADTVARMKPGSIIVDVAAEGGGNCELTEPGRTVVKHGVTIMGPANLPSELATDASLLYSRNITNFLLTFCKDGQFNLDLNDDILKGATITHGGQVIHGPTREMLEKSEPRP